MMMVKAHTAEKIKPRPERIKECLTCPRPTNTKICQRDYKKPQPVRILQLDMEDEEKKVKISSVKKKILPERLGPISNRKKSTKEEENGLHTYVKFKGLKRASRNLGFNNMGVGTVNNKTGNVDQLDKPTSTEQTSKEIPTAKTRISFLTVPNSIKNKYLQQCERGATKHSKLNVLKENIPLDKLVEQNTCSQHESRFKYLGPKTVKENECIKRLCNNLQSTEIILPENDLNAKHTSSEMFCINKKEFMHLKCELENLVSKTEGNLNNLKSTLKYVTKLLSIPQISISQSDTTKERETNVKIMLDKGIQVETCKLKQPTAKNSKFHDSETLNIVMNDKENVAIRCTDSFPDDTNESFENLENQLDIKHTKPVQKFSRLQNTPVIKKYRQKCPLKEYMSLKSTMSFLQTPDGKLSRQKDNIDGPAVENKSYISNKVLADLQNLYSDSPL